MNAPSSTIKAAGAASAAMAIFFVLLAAFAPEVYSRLPPGAGEIIVGSAGTLVGYFKKENVLTKPVAKKPLPGSKKKR